MKLPNGVWKPARRRQSNTALQKHPTLIELRRGKTFNLRADTGFAAYRYVDLTGTFSLQVPDLNFFQVLRQTIDGRREVYSNLEIGEQRKDLFELPSGESVIRRTKPGGIVAESPDEVSSRHAEDMLKRPLK
jgi:hypothetical protein